MEVWRNCLLLRCSSRKKLHRVQKNAVFLNNMLVFLRFLQIDFLGNFLKKNKRNCVFNLTFSEKNLF